MTAEELARRFEGCKLVGYLCPAGVPTIGYGHTGKEVYVGLVWTAEQAESELLHDLNCADTLLNLYSPNLPSGPREALTDFVFNLGIGSYRSSTLKQRVDELAWAAAKAELLTWDHCHGKVLEGLLERRQAEAALLP